MTARTLWLASYPKSGNTWLRALLTGWLEDSPVDVNQLVGTPIASSREAFDAALGIPSSSLTAAEIELVRPRADEVLASEADEPHLRKIHDAFAVGPQREPIVSITATRGALYVIRDPRDVVVSYAHGRNMSFEWARRRLNDPEAALSADENRLHEQLPQRLGTWSSHVRSWVDETPFPVEVIRYEDLATTPAERFGPALRFSGFGDVDERRLARAIECSSFDRLQRAEQDHGFREGHAGRSDFFRRGRPGSWRDELPAELAARTKEDHREVMARFGYD